MHRLLQRVDRGLGREPDIEQHLHVARDHVVRAGACVDVRDLEAGRLEVLVAAIPLDLDEFGERGQGEVDRVLREVRIRDVALHAPDRQRARERAAAAVLDRVAELRRRGRFADDAVVHRLVARTQRLDDAGRAVGRDAFFVGRDEQRDGTRMCRVRRDELLGGGHERRDRGLHVGGATPEEHAVADHGDERIAVPPIERARRDDVGVAREADDRAGRAAPCPEVVDVAVTVVRDREARGLEALREQLLAAVVGGRDGPAGDEVAREVQRGIGMLRGVQGH